MTKMDTNKIFKNLSISKGKKEGGCGDETERKEDYSISIY